MGCTVAKSDESLENLGPPAWTNWQRFIQNAAALNTYSAMETNLYSDTRLIGELMLRDNWVFSKDGGPYRIFYSFCDGESILDGVIHPRYILRAALVQDGSQWPQPVEGIDIEKEVAALLTLEIGARIVTGSRTRYINPEYAWGSPRAEANHPGQLQRRSSGHWLVPGFEKLQGVQDCAQFVTYPKLSRKHAATLTRAAISYSSALWVCESQPELAWLLLVSAIECVAATMPRPDPEASFEFPSELASVAAALPGDQREILSEYIQKRQLIKQKFLAFLERYLPPPPRQRLNNTLVRPANEGILKWDWETLKPLLGRIYDMRSSRLHSGVHFPAWTCERARPVRGQEELIWEYEPRPAKVKYAGEPEMTLNTFAYLTRQTIRNWWHSVVPINDVEARTG
jgi:hypothetical protein